MLGAKFGDNSLDYQLKSKVLAEKYILVNLDGFVEDFWKCSMKLSIGERQAPSKPAFTCSKVTIETLEQGVKYVQS